MPGSCAHMVLPLAAWPNSISWMGRWPCTEASPNLTAPKPLLSRKSPLHALLSWQLSLACLGQTSLPEPIPHCLSPPLLCSLLFLKPWTCSSHQKPSLILPTEGWPVPPLRQPHWAGIAETGKRLGEIWNPATAALSPLSQKAPLLGTVQEVRCDLATDPG